MPDRDRQPDATELELTTIFAALSDPTRLKIVKEFLKSDIGTERTCSSFNLELAKSTTSQHFQTLRKAGLISQVNYGNKSLATLRYEDVEGRFPGLFDVIGREGV